MNTVGIVGCGWLGSPLSRELQKEYDVECFARDKTWNDSSFWQRDTLIIAINTKDDYLNTLKKIASLAKDTCHMILMSSISVYREFEHEVDENAKMANSSLIKEAEELMLEAKENVVVLRLGGLMGDDRVSGRWKVAKDFSDGYVNYIHRDDVIEIVKQIIKKGIKSGVYNLVAPGHPLRSEIHARNAERFGFEQGSFSGMSSRIVHSDKIIKELDYEFIYPDPLYFWG